MWHQGSLVQLRIVDLASNGCGVGRIQNRVVFVPDSVPGDVLLVRLIKTKRAYAEGRTVEVMEASKDRIRPRCIVADKCGGCQWQHVEYETQIAYKQKQVKDALKRIGGFSDVPLQDGMPSDPFGYRNRAIYPLGRSSTNTVKAGYYQKRTHSIVNINQCPVQDPRLDRLLKAIKQDLQPWEIYDASDGTGSLKHLSLRIGQRTGEVLVTVVSTSEKLPDMKERAVDWMTRFPIVVGVCVNTDTSRSNKIFGDRTMALHGRATITERFCGLKLSISSTAFFQVNTRTAEAMALSIVDGLKLRGDETIVDGYAGIGTLILPIAHCHPKTDCIAVDTHPASVRCASENARNNDIDNIQFKTGRFEDVLLELGSLLDVVLLDPPRKGCDPRVLTQLLDVRPKRIVYVSCKPASLARDLDLLCCSGAYEIESVVPVDMFPQTSNVESVTWLKLNA